jgi:GNAT superfamily N-acetyltransferase
MTIVTTYFLEMNSSASFVPKESRPDLVITECEIKQWQYNRFLYALVGHAWHWTDKLSWTDAQWEEYVHNINLRTWVAYHRGTPAGYYELQSQEEGSVEIAYFGLEPDFIGKGYGGYLLSHAILSAWSMPETKRVWVHTCSLDHPSALQNYQARGLKIYKELIENR